MHCSHFVWNQIHAGTSLIMFFTLSSCVLWILSKSFSRFSSFSNNFRALSGQVFHVTLSRRRQSVDQMSKLAWVCLELNQKSKFEFFSFTTQIAFCKTLNLRSMISTSCVFKYATCNNLMTINSVMPSWDRCVLFLPTQSLKHYTTKLFTSVWLRYNLTRAFTITEIE